MQWSPLLEMDCDVEHDGVFTNVVKHVSLTG